jgi:hypothetical protein
MKVLTLVHPLLTLALISLAASPNASAKDLTKRLGVGYRNQLSVDVPQVAAQYYASPDLAFGASLGIESGNSNNKMGIMARVHRVIFPEDNLNFYMGGGGGVISTRTGSTNESGFELMGFLGAEFFLPGLESLSLSFEAGVGVTSLPSGVTFRTFGDSPLRAGMLFYF